MRFYILNITRLSLSQVVWRRLRGVLAEYLPTIGKSAPRVLDMGCGVGQFTHWLQAAGYEVLGIDRSAEMLAEAKRRFPEVRYVNGNIKYYEDHDIKLITCLGKRSIISRAPPNFTSL